jgi:glycosyl transferase family 11
VRVPNLPDLKAAALSVVRRGPRTVLWTPDLFGFGNVLYGWLRAHARQAAGDDTVALLTATGARWLPLLDGRADALVVRRPEVGLTDRREPGAPFVFGEDFTRGQLESFLDDVVLPSSLSDPTAATLLHPDDVVVVVRRGDYWSVPEFRSRYAFDTDSYLRAALALQEEAGGPIGRVHVVSDGLGWCRAHLGWLADGGRRLTFATADQTPRDHFATMVGARRLVVTNTTFGYWGGYGATRRHGEGSIVVAPRFHARGIPRGERAVNLDPRWSIVETIAGGWVEPPPSPDDRPDPGP